jgi:hypothetical protein
MARRYDRACLNRSVKPGCGGSGTLVDEAIDLRSSDAGEPPTWPQSARRWNPSATRHLPDAVVAELIDLIGETVSSN